MPLDIGAIVGFAIIMAVAALHFLSDKSEWEPCSPTFRKVKLIDGTMASHSLMRRKVNGRWEYRKMTDEEVAESIAASAAP